MSTTVPLYGDAHIAHLDRPYMGGSQRWTAERRSVVETYIRVLQKKLRLQDWTVTIDWDTVVPDDDAYAQNTAETRSKHCCISFSNKFLELDPELQRQTLVHEMLHAHFFPLADLVDITVSELVKRSAHNIFSVAMDHQVEYAVDALADAIAPLMPDFVLP
jgi:hypothetical protein